MVRPPHDFPGIAVIVDVASPCKRLEADADSVPRRPFAELVEIGGGAVDAAKRHGRQVGADEDQVGAEFTHQSRSKLDAYEAFILGLIEDAPDITLAEIGGRLAAERDVRAAPSTVWLFLDRRGITFKKRRRTPQSSSVPMSCAAAWPGSTASSTSTPRG
jgi:transposase